MGFDFIFFIFLLKVFLSWKKTKLALVEYARVCHVLYSVQKLTGVTNSGQIVTDF